MPAPTISHLICSMALVVLISIMPYFYSLVVNDIGLNMVQRELREIADYTSNTLSNLYFLTNSTNCPDVNLTKELLYLPPTIEDSVYVLRIDDTNGSASKITAYLRDKLWVSSGSWLVPGLKVGASNSIESSGRTVVAGCTRNVTGVYAWISYGW